MSCPYRSKSDCDSPLAVGDADGCGSEQYSRSLSHFSPSLESSVADSCLCDVPWASSSASTPLERSRMFEPYQRAGRWLVPSIALLSSLLAGHAVFMLMGGASDLAIPQGDAVTEGSVKVTYTLILSESVLAVVAMLVCFRFLYCDSRPGPLCKSSNVPFICLSATIVVLFCASLIAVAAPIAYARISTNSVPLWISFVVAVARSTQFICVLQALIVNPKVTPADPLLRTFVLSILSDKSI